MIKQSIHQTKMVLKMIELQGLKKVFLKFINVIVRMAKIDLKNFVPLRNHIFSADIIGFINYH